jgi:peptidoglycan LD-endopeptidase LytH
MVQTPRKSDPEAWRKRAEQARLDAKKRMAVVTWISALVLAAGLALPDSPIYPIKGATTQDWNPGDFWRETSDGDVQRGIVVAGMVDATVQAANYGLVIAVDAQSVNVLGPTWRVHHYQNLAKVNVHWGSWISKGQAIGQLGGSTNELHYHLITLLPYLWRVTPEREGWRKMFYLDPTYYLAPETVDSQPRRPEYKTYVN